MSGIPSGLTWIISVIISGTNMLIIQERTTDPIVSYLEYTAIVDRVCDLDQILKNKCIEENTLENTVKQLSRLHSTCQ